MLTVLKKFLATDIPTPKRVEILKTRQGIDVFLVEEKGLLWRMDDQIYPTLLVPLLYENRMPRIFVDEGAVPHILNGADVMRPGIVDMVNDFEEGDVVCIYEEKYRKPIAVGIALFSSDDMRKMSRGKVVKNIHHLKDKLWNFILQYSRLK